MLHSEFSTIKTTFLFDKNLNGTEIKLLWVISSLSKAGVGCFASNEYLSKCMDMNKTSVSDILTKLDKEKYIVRKSINNPETGKTEIRLIFINHEKNIEIPDFLKEKEEYTPLRKIPNPPSENSETYMYSNTLNGNNTTDNNTLSNTNTPVPDLNDLHRPELENTLEASKHLAPNMVTLFLKKYPNYMFFKEVDYKAAFQIAKYIAKESGIQKSKMLDIASCQIILEKWAKYLDFISQHRFLCTRSLTQLSAESQWQNVIQEMAAAKKAQPGKSDYQNEYERKKAEYYAKSKERQKSEME